MTRAAQDASADVVVEVARQRANLQSERHDRALHLELHARPARAEREEDARALAAQSCDGARQEQTSAPHRVRRVGDNRVEAAGERCRERPAGVPAQALNRKRRTVELGADELEQPLVDVQDSELLDGQAELEGEAEERDGHEIVVAEQQDPAAADCTGVVHRQHAAQLGLRRAMALVEFDERGRRRIGKGREAAPQPGDSRRERHTAPAARRAQRLDPGAACPKSSSSFERELNGTGLRDLAALTQLPADSRDDRDGEVRRAAERAHGDRLEARERSKDGLDAARALGQADRACDLVDDLISQRREGRRSRRHAQRRGVRGSLRAPPRPAHRRTRAGRRSPVRVPATCEG